MEEFKKLGLTEDSIKALEIKGFTEPTYIQKRVIPLLLEGEKDIIGQSQTGTGKTASFALPLLQNLKEHNKTVQVIVLTPTRELALQVADEINSLKGNKKIKILAVYGGAPIGNQLQKLKAGIDIVVGTPGRVMDLQKRKSLRLETIKYAVLDEADEMLNMGFVEDIENILRCTPKDKIMLLFSATMPKQILKIAEKYMREYDFIKVEKTNVITKTVEQIYYDINARDRLEGLRRILDYTLNFHGIIFCNTRDMVDTLAVQINKLNYNAAALHGDITQAQREKILQQFRNGNVKVLVATDVAARGIDVNDLTHVINFSLPQSPEAYVHRIGRTGRAGKKGLAITFVIPSEKGKLKFVERINQCKLEKRTLPSVKEIMEKKEGQIKEIIKSIIKSNKSTSSKYDFIVNDLLKEYSPEQVILAVLKYSLKNDLDASSYKEISEPTGGSSRNGRSGPKRRGFRRDRQRSSTKFRKKPREGNRNSGNRRTSSGKRPYSKLAFRSKRR